MSILISGDTHGDAGYIKRLCIHANENNIKDIIVCGDFGYWPRLPDSDIFFKKLNAFLLHHDLSLYFVDGNHEDFEDLYKLPLDVVSEIPQSRNCYYIPRAVTIEIDGRKIMGFGGGVSIDKDRRINRQSWFSEETIKPEEIGRIKDKDVDILITHDAPMNLARGFKNDPESQMNRDMIKQIIGIVNPKILCHGHYHIHQEYEFLETKCYGLDCNLTFDIDESTVIL